MTNLIAAAMAQGKTILFVAEKQAALQVVRKRLNDAGLGIFCLEVHSNKSRKQDVLGDIASRIHKYGQFSDPCELTAKLELLYPALPGKDPAVGDLSIEKVRASVGGAHDRRAVHLQHAALQSHPAAKIECGRRGRPV